MLDKTRQAAIDLAISQAQDVARNKHAISHINAAHARLIEAVIRNQPPSFSIPASADDFSEAEQYLRKLAAAFDEVVYQVMSEASCNSDKIIHVSPVLITDALHDADVFAGLNNAADDLREAECGRSDYAEHNTHHRALSGV